MAPVRLCLQLTLAFVLSVLSGSFTAPLIPFRVKIASNAYAVRNDTVIGLVDMRDAETPVSGQPISYYIAIDAFSSEEEAQDWWWVHHYNGDGTVYVQVRYKMDYWRVPEDCDDAIEVIPSTVYNIVALWTSFVASVALSVCTILLVTRTVETHFSWAGSESAEDEKKESMNEAKDKNVDETTKL